jgi:uncharacterized delta-60 repeat protein
MLRHAVPLAALVLLSLAPSAMAQAPLAPSLSIDTKFAPTSGIARHDFTSGTASDVPNGVAVHGGRIYEVGETRNSSGDANVGIIARRTDGSFDAGFSGDGKLVIPVAAGTGRDLGAGITVLSDGRLRIVGATDVDPGTATNLDALVIGLNADGSVDTTFGGGDGIVTFSIAGNTNNDQPNRIVSDALGRLAITGARNDGSKDDMFVSLRLPDGSPAPFGTDGVKTVNRAGTTLNDRGIDVAFRPGGGVMALVQVETNADATLNDWTSVLMAFKDNGDAETAFDGDGDKVLAIAGGNPDTVPGSVIAHDGRLWVTGNTKAGTDTDAYLARVDADGSGLQTRRFDMRTGSTVDDDQPVISQGLDLAVVPGNPETLVVVGSMTSDLGTDWAAAAFNNFGGNLAAAGYGDTVIPTPGLGALVGAAASPEGWVAIGGSLLDTSTTDTSFGMGRLLIDADKRCDLSLEVLEPLEVLYRSSAPVPLRVRVTNAGTRTCGGELGVPAPYRLIRDGVSGPVATGSLAPGQVFNGDLRLAYDGPRRADDAIVLRLTSAADVNTQNNARAMQVVFRYCDLALSSIGRGGAAPVDGSRRYEYSIRNVGTGPCRDIRVSVADGGRVVSQDGRFTLQRGRSATHSAWAAVDKGGRVGQKVKLLFRAIATGDVTARNDRASRTVQLLRGGQSRPRAASARRLAGTATAGRSPGASAARVGSVHVAVLRVGGARCRWLAAESGRLRPRTKPSAGGCASRPLWVRADGARRWSLALDRALPSGRYVVLSRVTTSAGFREVSYGRRTFRAR